MQVRLFDAELRPEDLALFVQVADVVVIVDELNHRATTAAGPPVGRVAPTIDVDGYEMAWFTRRFCDLLLDLADPAQLDQRSGEPPYTE